MEDISENMEPPGYSLPRIWATIKRRGILKAMDDEEMGPHVHLTYLLLGVAFIATIIAVVVIFVM